MAKREERKKPEAIKRINQFIIECMFSKYFEEQKDNKVVIEREKVTV